MSKMMQNILKIQEQTGINLVKQQKEAEYYGVPMTAEEIEQELMKDEGYQRFLDSLEDKNKPF